MTETHRKFPGSPGSSLDELRTTIWRELEEAAMNDDHPFRVAALATGNDGDVHVRTVILRSVDARRRELILHTDSRSAKLRDLQQRPSVAWLFYDHDRGLQVRVRAEAEIHTKNDVSQRQWQQLSSWSKRLYCAEQPPGTVVDKPTDGLPAQLEETPPNVRDQALAYTNFAVVITRATYVDWLCIDRSGHKRAQFNWRENRWVGHWVIP